MRSSGCQKVFLRLGPAQDRNALDDAVLRSYIGVHQQRHAHQLLLGTHRGVICTGDAMLRRSRQNVGDWQRLAFLLRLRFDLRNRCLDRDQKNEPGGAIDRECATAKGCDLDCSA